MMSRPDRDKSTRYPTSFRMSPALHKTLKMAARRSGRSLGAEIELRLEIALLDERLRLTTDLMTEEQEERAARKRVTEYRHRLKMKQTLLPEAEL